jgi:phosphoglycerate dehydrogenase-like enzyme
MWSPDESLKDYLTSGLQQYKNLRLIFAEDTEPDNLIERSRDADIIVGWRPTGEMINNASRLRLFINPGAGVQHLIDLFRKINEQRTVILANGHGNTYFAAQHAVALLHALMNKIIPHHNWMVRGQWRKGDKDAVSIPLRDRIVGLFGYGAINQKVHRFLSGYDINYAILRRDWNNKDRPDPSIKAFSSHELGGFFEYCDIVIVAVPLTDLTRGLIAADELAHLGNCGILVNVARGEVINERDLFEALKYKTIAGAAIDVWYDYRPEPLNGLYYPYKYPFHELDNVVMSPHRAASPFSDLKRWDDVIENIKRFARNDSDFLNVVDLKRGY